MKILKANLPNKPGFSITLQRTTCGYAIYNEVELKLSVDGHEEKDFKRLKRRAREFYGTGLKWKIEEKP